MRGSIDAIKSCRALKLIAAGHLIAPVFITAQEWKGGPHRASFTRLSLSIENWFVQPEFPSSCTPHSVLVLRYSEDLHCNRNSSALARRLLRAHHL